MPKGEPVLIQGIWLIREGDKAVVLVELPDGTYQEAISEHIDGQFSHHISEHGLRGLNKPRTF